MLVETGTGARRRILKIDEISKELGVNCCKALPGIHAFTGNDYTSAFHGIGKIKAYKTMVESDEFVHAFGKIGEHFDFNAEYFSTIEKFVCTLYGATQCRDVNEARYVKFCSSAKATEPEKLPPTRDALLYHCKRVNYVTAVVKRSLENNPVVPEPHEGYGWSLEDGKLEIKWMLLPPAPPQVLELITCGCKKGCRSRTCSCVAHGIKCTVLCKCKDCTNSLDDFSDEYASDDSSESDDEEEESADDDDDDLSTDSDDDGINLRDV